MNEQVCITNGQFVEIGVWIDRIQNLQETITKYSEIFYASETQIIVQASRVNDSFSTLTLILDVQASLRCGKLLLSEAYAGISKDEQVLLSLLPVTWLEHHEPRERRRGGFARPDHEHAAAALRALGYFVSRMAGMLATLGFEQICENVHEAECLLATWNTCYENEMRREYSREFAFSNPYPDFYVPSSTLPNNPVVRCFDSWIEYLVKPGEVYTE